MNWVGRQLRKSFRFWFGPIEEIRLRAFEVAFTLTFLCYFYAARFHYWREWLTPEGYHYSRGATPSFLIDPFPLLQPWSALALGAVTGIAGIFVILGRFRKPALATLAAVSIYIQNADALSAFALNAHYIVGFVVLLLAPGRLVPPKDRIAREHVLIGSAWPVRTLQLTFLLQIFTAGWCKVEMGDWLNHSDVLWSHVQGPYRNHLASWLLRTVPMWGWTVMQWGAFLFELVGPFLIAIRRTRWVGLLWAVGFTAFIAATMNDLQYFAMQLASYLTLFLPITLLELARGQLARLTPRRRFRKHSSDFPQT
ncbi:MAG: HTTM domain-containing protein [Verrucomicrobiales bacterium]